MWSGQENQQNLFCDSFPYDYWYDGSQEQIAICNTNDNQISNVSVADLFQGFGLDPSYPKDGSTLSEAIALSLSQKESEDVLHLPLDIEITEIKEELPEVDCNNNNVLDDFLDFFQVKPEREENVRVKEEPARQEGKQTRKPRKRKQNFANSSAIPNLPLPQWKQPIGLPKSNSSGQRKTRKAPKALIKTEERSAEIDFPKVRLYKINPADCKDPKQKQRVQRAINTKMFHEKQKEKIEKLKKAQEIMEHLLTIPECRMQLETNAGIMEKIKTCFSDSPTLPSFDKGQ